MIHDSLMKTLEKNGAKARKDSLPRNEILSGDCVENMKTLPARSVDLIDLRRPAL